MSRTEYFFYITEGIVAFIVLFTWLAGIAIAKGVWSTIFAVLIPPYAWYLLVEKIILPWLG
jgi:hypothetical protein